VADSRYQLSNHGKRLYFPRSYDLRLIVAFVLWPLGNGIGSINPPLGSIRTPTYI